MVSRNQKPVSRSDFAQQLHEQLSSTWMQHRLLLPTMSRAIRQKISAILKVDILEENQQQQQHQGRKICGFCPSKKRRMTSHFCVRCARAMCGEHQGKWCQDLPTNLRNEGCYSSDDDEVLHIPYNHRHRTVRRDFAALKSAVMCLAQAILDGMEHVATCAPLQSTLTSEQDCLNTWAQASPCSCTFLTQHQARRKFSQKKLNFNENGFDIEDTEHVKTCQEETVTKCIPAPADSSGEESDTSDTSEGEFFTPPSSPGIRSDDDLAMESPDEGPDVYINGSAPSKLDVSVLEAIRDCEISKVKFPNIYRWRHLVMLHSQQERESWMASPKKRLPSGASPMWHRTPSLHRD